MNRQGQLLTNDSIVRNLRLFMASGVRSGQEVPDIVKDICRNGRWRERLDEQTRERHECKTFEEFVTTEPLRGLGSSVDVLKRLCRDDKEARDAIDDALKGTSQQGRRNDLLDNIQDVPAPTGTSIDRSLRKLRTEAAKSPAVRKVYEKVLAGEMSPHRGMVECGFRKVPTPLEQIKRLARKMTAKERRDLVAWLEGLS